MYKRDRGPIWLSDVKCLGYERHFNQCRHSRWGIHNCSHSQDVSISCTYTSPLTYAGQEFHGHSSFLCSIVLVSLSSRTYITWNSREWTKRHGQKRGCGKCRSGQFGTMLQRWTLQEWTNQHDVARVAIAGVDNVAPCGRGGQH